MEQNNFIKKQDSRINRMIYAAVLFHFLIGILIIS